MQELFEALASAAKKAAERVRDAGVELCAKEAELPEDPAALQTLSVAMVAYKSAFDALRPPAKWWSEVRNFGSYSRKLASVQLDHTQ